MSTEKTKHTPGPWYATDDDTDTWWAITTDDGQVIADLSDSSFDSRVDRVNAARVVACVNACEGIDDPERTLIEVRRLLTEAVNAKRSKDTMAHTFAALTLLWPRS